MNKLFAATATVLVLIAVPAAVSAAPNNPEVGNFLTLKLGPAQGQFRGAVHTQVLECAADRKVRIVRVEGESKTRIATGYTAGDGHFSIQTEEASGSWFAKIKRLDIGDGYYCAAAKTKVKSAG